MDQDNSEKEERILEREDILKALKEETQKLIVKEDKPLEIIWLAIFSCILIEQPFGILVRSPSSAGKSFIINKIIEILSEKYNAIQVDNEGTISFKPGFGFIDCNKFTLAGLTRATEGNPYALQGKIIFLHELPDDASDNTKELYQALRQYFSDGKYSRILTDEKTKRAIHLRLKGYCCMISETAKSVKEEEWGNRFLFINLDESQKQNVAIAEFQAKKYLEPWNIITINYELIEEIIDHFLYEDVHKDCKNLEVYNPWVEDIRNNLLKKYGKDVRIRRYTDLTFRACETITRLQYKQREKRIHPSGMPYLRAEKWDTAKCLWLFESMLIHTMSKLTIANISWLKKIYKKFGTEEWTSPQAQHITGLSKSNVYGKIQDLKDYGLIYQCGKQSRTFKYQINEEYYNSNLNVHHRSMNDILVSLPERTYLDVPIHDRSSDSTPSPFEGDILDLQNDLPESSMESVEGSTNKVIVQRTLKNDKLQSRQIEELTPIDKIGSLIDKWIEESEEEWINVKPTIDCLVQEGFNRKLAKKVIDEGTRRGIYFEPQPGRISKP